MSFELENGDAAASDETTSSLLQYAPGLYGLDDTCNAYALVDGDEALVIDPGSGSILRALADEGIQPAWALHTHHHRDQCWGTHRLVDDGAKVAVPEHEAHLFEDVETFWASKRIYDNYNDRSTFFTLGDPLPVRDTLDDYDTWTWRGWEMDVLPAKGHTTGSSVLLTDVQDNRVAFTGDLFRAGGYLHTLHDLEYGYGDMKGVPFTIQSLQALKRANPDVCLPSHGAAITEPMADADQLIRRLMQLVDLGPRMNAGTRAYLPEARMISVSDHLLWSGPWACSNFYVVRADSGKALFVDYGHSMQEHMQIRLDREDMETMRFVEHHLDELREHHGVDEFDVVVPTHIHDDHTCGIPHLQEHHDVECWALDTVAAVLEEPAAWASTPCLFSQDIEVDRQLSDGECFEWEGFEFTIRYAPGQTEFHSVLSGDIDGQTVAFTGDNYFERETDVHPDRREDRPYQQTIFRNSFRPEMHRRCKAVMRAVRPDLVCPGHGEILETDDRSIRRYCDFIDRKERIFEDLTNGSTAQRADLFWTRLLPYHSRVAPGETVEYDVLVRNNFDEERVYDLRLLGFDGWSTIDEGRVDLPPGKQSRVELSFPVPAETSPGRHLVTVAVSVDGEDHGPIAEALVETR
jgi:glyoxylase-like metal-dependent hydrolase (beta-lactamase superfamily II)